MITFENFSAQSKLKPTLTINVVFFFVLTGRMTKKLSGFHQVKLRLPGKRFHYKEILFFFFFCLLEWWWFLQIINEDKTILRPRIGSRPPKCERRCRSCEHCEAIQVPTNPRAQNGKKNSWKFSSVTYARVGGSSNYKPMSWKCKCGNLIFNPWISLYHN